MYYHVTAILPGGRQKSIVNKTEELAKIAKLNLDIKRFRLDQGIAEKELGRHVGKRVLTVGWLITGKLVETKKGEPMEFLSFEDTTDIYETTFFPRAYDRFCRILTNTRPFLLAGKVEEDYTALTLTVDEARYLEAVRSGPEEKKKERPAGRAASPGPAQTRMIG